MTILLLFVLFILLYNCYGEEVKIGFLVYKGSIANNVQQEEIQRDMEKIISKRGFIFKTYKFSISLEMELESVFDRILEEHIYHIFGTFYNGKKYLSVSLLQQLASKNNQMVWHLDDVELRFCNSNIISFYRQIALLPYFSYFIYHYSIDYIAIYDPAHDKISSFLDLLVYLKSIGVRIVETVSDIAYTREVLQRVKDQKIKAPILLCMSMEANEKFIPFYKTMLNGDDNPIIIPDCNDLSDMEAFQNPAMSLESGYFISSSIISSVEILKEEYDLPDLTRSALLSGLMMELLSLIYKLKRDENVPIETLDLYTVRIAAPGYADSNNNTLIEVLPNNIICSTGMLYRIEENGNLTQFMEPLFNRAMIRVKANENDEICDFSKGGFIASDLIGIGLLVENELREYSDFDDVVSLFILLFQEINSKGGILNKLVKLFFFSDSDVTELNNQMKTAYNQGLLIIFTSYDSYLLPEIFKDVIDKELIVFDLNNNIGGLCNKEFFYISFN